MDHAITIGDVALVGGVAAIVVIVVVIVLTVFASGWNH